MRKVGGKVRDGNSDEARSKGLRRGMYFYFSCVCFINIVNIIMLRKCSSFSFLYLAKSTIKLLPTKNYIVPTYVEETLWPL